MTDQIIPDCCKECVSFDYFRGHGSCDLGRILPTRKKICTQAIYLQSSLKNPSGKRGGTRPGAGRKKSDNPRIKWSGYLPADIIQLLKSKSEQYNMSQSNVISDVIRLSFPLIFTK